MKFLLKKIQALFFIFFLSSCDSFFVSQTFETIHLQKIQDDSSFTRFVSLQPVSAILSKEYYFVKAHLPSEQSKVELFSHFREVTLEDGVKVQFLREGTSLVIKISVQSYPEKLLLEKESYFLNSKELDLTVEVENGTHYGFRVRIWENFINKNGMVKNEMDILTDENLIADSLVENLTFYTKGQGLKWGLKLFRSSLIKGARVSPTIL